MKKFKIKFQRPRWDYWGFGGWEFDVIPRLAIVRNNALHLDNQGNDWLSYEIRLRWLFCECDLILNKRI